MICTLREINGIAQCTECETLYPGVPLDMEIECMAKKGLGDYTESVLKKMGVTESRYKEIKKKFGLAPTCNCRGRKKWLNKVGAYIKGNR